MKKLNLTKTHKLIIKIAAAVLYFSLLLFLIIRGMSTEIDVNGIEIIKFSSTAFTIFGRDIYFYALAIITGIGIAYIYANHIAKKIGFKEDNLFDGFIIGVILGILGARLWYAIFEWHRFKDNPIEIITGFISGNGGGLAIHGAVIVAAIFAYFFCKKRNEDVLKLGEMLAPGFLIGQVFGRWGNFFNKEAHGGAISDSVLESRQFLEKLPIPKFVIDQMYIGRNYVHPTFLYESVWNLIGLFLIIFLRNKTKKYWYGDAILFYLVWYGTGRFFIEMMRTDAMTFELFGVEFRTAMVISTLMFVSGITLFILRRLKKFRPISYLEIVEENKQLNEEGLED